MSLASRNAIVTGSTSGIGLAIARALAKEGANIMINGFGDAAAIETERAGIESEFGVKCVYDGADMSKGDQIAAMVHDAEQKLGAVDILVNNAGINRDDEVCRMVVVLIDAKPLGFTEHLRSRENEHRQLNEGHKG